MLNNGFKAKTSDFLRCAINLETCHRDQYSNRYYTCFLFSCHLDAPKEFTAKQLLHKSDNGLIFQFFSKGAHRIAMERLPCSPKVTDRALRCRGKMTQSHTSQASKLNVRTSTSLHTRGTKQAQTNWDRVQRGAPLFS